MDWKRLIPSWARRTAVRAGALPPTPVPTALWQATVTAYPFLKRLTLSEDERLQLLVAHFLQRKEFSGAHGLVVTDAMAIAIAVQACVLLLYWGEPSEALRWYDDFVGIVVHEGEVVAHREMVDEAGVVHHYDETLLGEAMEGGPVMLSWSAVQPHHTAHKTALETEQSESQQSASAATETLSHTNVVIHEFAHILDLRDGDANGCPPLPIGFMGYSSASAARQAWSAIWNDAYASFRDQVIRHERFDQPAPWLDPYGAEAPAEFFAVACEGYWLDRERMSVELPEVVQTLDAFFHRPTQSISISK